MQMNTFLHWEGLSDHERFVNRASAAVILCRSVPTLERWAKANYGPKPRRVGGRVLYSMADIKAFAGLEKAA